MSLSVKDLLRVIAGSVGVQGLRGQYKDEYLLEKCHVAAHACYACEDSLGAAMAFACQHAGRIHGIGKDGTIRDLVGISHAGLESSGQKSFTKMIEEVCSHETEVLDDPQKEPELDVIVPVVEPVVPAPEPEVEVIVPADPVPVVPVVEPAIVPTPEVTPVVTPEVVAESAPAEADVPVVVPVVDVNSLSVEQLAIRHELKQALIAAGLTTIGQVEARFKVEGLEPLPGIGKVSEGRIMEAIVKLKG